MLNDDEIVTSMQAESDLVDDKMDEDEDSNNDSSKGPSNAGAFSALETTMEWYEQQSECSKQSKRRCTMVQQKMVIFHNKDKIVTFCTYFAFSSSTFPACDDFQYSRSVRFHILHGSHTFGYPNNRLSERCPVPIDWDKRRSTV
ncbi:uncharacterized protein TNCV_1148651 [Trichonephila clavipes]|nr:uncharacterized protein TNCV_1148651 [Trichonephila clavipes]